MTEKPAEKPTVLVPFPGAPTEDLERWRARYTGRRTVPHELLVEAEALVEAGVAQAAAFYAGQLVTSQQMLTAAQDSLERAREEAERLRGERALHESRRPAQRPTGFEEEGLVELTVARGVPGWTVGDLEEAAFRLRCAGGTDDTRVDMSNTAAVAIVPSPSSIPLTVAPQRPTTLIVHAPEYGSGAGWRIPKAVALAIMITAALLLVIFAGVSLVS